MGTEFIRNTRAAHRKAWAETFAAVSKDLVASIPLPVERTYLAVMEPSATPEPGMVLLARCDDKRVILTLEGMSVGYLRNAPQPLVDALEKAGALCVRVASPAHEAGYVSVEIEP